MIEIDVFDFGHKLHFPSHCEPFRCVLFLLSSLSYSAIFEAYCDTKFSVGRQKMTLHLCPQSPPPPPGPLCQATMGEGEGLMPGYNPRQISGFLQRVKIFLFGTAVMHANYDVNYA